jgi:dipeptidyl aminopeptidase/acylaminoacyl peptidase
MNYLNPIRVLLLLVLTNSFIMLEAQNFVPLEDFFRNPEKSSYNISPDGNYFSFMAPYENRMNIFVQKAGSKKAERLTSETDRDIAGYFWANDKRILFLKDNGGDENYALFGVDIDGKNLKCLTCFENVRTQIIDDLEDQPDEVIIGLNKRNPMVFDPYRLNIKTGDMVMLAENPGNIQGWMTDHAGKLRVAFAIVDGINTQILYRDKETEDFRPILTTSFKETMGAEFFTFDNKYLYATSNINRDKQAAVIFDPATGKEIEVLYENDSYDVSGIAYSRKRKVITAAVYTSWKRERHFFDEESKALFNRLEKELVGYEISISASSKAEDKYIVRTYSDRSLGAYYFFDKKKNVLTKIQDVSPWIDENQMAEIKPITYRSRDGLIIHGYLTLPKGVEAKNLPVVVNPHGGPWARDNWGFNPEVQFLANRGYAVLQMNFRGSTGYGRKFWEASFKQWGLNMQNDITDGVYWLIEQGIADPKRIAIYGASYGGYATLQGLVVTPTLYAAAVDYVGVSNLFTFMNTIPPYWKPLLDMMYEMVGHPEKDSLQMEATSPALNAHRIMTPLFVAQGANDPRVNIAESDQIVEAMRKRGVEVEYMVKDNEGHGFSNEENRFDFYRAMETFLAKHLKN